MGNTHPLCHCSSDDGSPDNFELSQEQAEVAALELSACRCVSRASYADALSFLDRACDACWRSSLAGEKDGSSGTAACWRAHCLNARAVVRYAAGDSAGALGDADASCAAETTDVALHLYNRGLLRLASCCGGASGNSGDEDAREAAARDLRKALSLDPLLRSHVAAPPRGFAWKISPPCA
eukprot:Rhum_TRINITY_DN13959_c0_g3::Rhum_TRINITY_DN13959_c0_g3_i1::g.66305::m.66305